MRLLLSVILLCNGLWLHAQDYFKYHEGIITAEEQIFVKQQYDEGLKTYADVFKKYDFVFAHDCVMAMQIALYRNNEKLFLLFTTKAMQNGLTMKHLDSRTMTYFQTHPIYNKCKDSIASIYKRNRPHYLKRIDTVALGKMTQLFCNDQLEKNPLPNEGFTASDKRYKPQIIATTEQLKALIAERGYPSDRLIGIDDQNLLHELGTTRMTPLDYYKKYKGDQCCNIRESQFEFDEHTISSSMIMPLIIHYGHMTNGEDRLQCVMYSDSFYLQQIKRGYIHPKDVAFLYEWSMNNGGSGAGTPNLERGEKFFDIGIRRQGAQRQVNITDETINKLRVAFHIAPIENDRMKFEFVKKNGMYIGFGWWTCRS